MSEITAKSEKAIKAVLNDVFDNFDFEKVKRTMDALNWTWCWIDEKNAVRGPRTPTIDEIKQTAADLLWSLATDPNPENTIHASGGFRAERDFSDPENPWVRLSFEVTEWDAAASELGD